MNPYEILTDEFKSFLTEYGFDLKNTTRHSFPTYTHSHIGYYAQNKYSDISEFSIFVMYEHADSSPIVVLSFQGNKFKICNIKKYSTYFLEYDFDCLTVITSDNLFTAGAAGKSIKYVFDKAFPNVARDQKINDIFS